MKYCLFLFILLLTNCDDAVQIQRSDADPALVVRGVIYDGLPLQLYVARAQPQITGIVDYSVRDALVEVIKDGVPEARLFEFNPFSGGSGQPIGNTGFWYRSPDPIFLAPGSVYQLRIQTEGVPTLTSVPIEYKPSVRIDSIDNFDAVVKADGRTFEERVNFTTHLTTLNENEGELRVHFGLSGGGRVSDTTSLRRTGSNFDFPRGRSDVLINPEFQDTVFNAIFENELITYSGDVVLSLEYTFFQQDYLEFLAQLSIGNRFEDVAGLDARLDNLPTNIQNGYGFFTLADRHRYWVPLPQ